MKTVRRRRRPQFNLMFKIPNSYEGRAFLSQARHYLNKASYRLTAVATDPIGDGKRCKNGGLKQRDANTFNIYINFKNGRVRPLGIKNHKRLRYEVVAQDDLVGELLKEIERLEHEVRDLQADSQEQRSGLMDAVRNRLNAVTRR